MKTGPKPKTLILYEPQFNHETKVTVKLMMAMLGLSESRISRLVSDRTLIKQINCYLLKEKPTVAEKRKMIASLKFKDEAWRESKLADLYVSSKGRFRSKTKSGWRYYFPYKFKNSVLIKYQKNSYKANRLVYETWHGEIPNGYCVYAKNGIKHEISADNLKVATREELERMTGYKSTSKEVALLDENGEIIEEFRSAREASRHLFVSHQTVADCCNKRWLSPACGMYNFKWLEDIS